jgi:predicted Zn-dependent protease
MSKDFSFDISFCESILRRDPDDLPTMELLAEKLTRAGRLDEGLALDRRIVLANPDNAVSHYNLACSLALTNRTRDAIKALRTAMEKGYREFSWLMEDPDLRRLHDLPEFSALIAEFQTAP